MPSVFTPGHTLLIGGGSSDIPNTVGDATACHLLLQIMSTVCDPI
jgi:hypothetical protein